MKTCPKCKVEKTLGGFTTRKDGRPAGICKVCAAKNTRDWNERNPERKRQSYKDWEKKNPEKLRDYRNKRRYGLSREEYEGLPQECAICGTTENLVLDHDHNTNKFRGVLCHHHNVGLGFFKDDPVMLLRAVDYLLGVLKPLVLDKITRSSR